MADKEPDTQKSRQVIDDEQLKRMLAANKPGLIERNSYRLVTLILIVVNVVVFAVEVLNSGMRVDISLQVLVDMGAMYAPLIRSVGDLYRFVTPIFLHMDPLHITFNMMALYSVGGTLERVLGKGNFIALYLISGITGNAVSYVVYALYFTGAQTVSAGASTSVFGLFIAVALLGLLYKGNRNYFRQYSRSMLTVIGINVAYSFLVPGISISGHLGGALGGLIALFMLPSKNLRVNTVLRIGVALLWSAGLIYLLLRQGIILT